MSMDYSGTPGEYIYSHNATGKSASGIIANGSTSERDLGAQRSAGGADRQAGDQGGHLIADRFGGRNDPTNLDAQAANVNQKDQANVERNVANLAANPNNTVSMNVSNFNSVGERPDATMINVGVQDNTTGAIDEQHISFQNASHEMQQSWNDTANQADQTVDSSQNAGMTDEQIDIANDLCGAEDDVDDRLALVIFGIIVACLAWKYTLHIATGAVPAINQMNEQIAYETDCAKNTSEENRFEYTQFGTIYHAPTGIDVGPFKYLYTDEFYFSWENVARYIGNNGKYGYLKKDGNLLTDPIFVEAAEFADGTARVQETSGKIYYINEEGKRITKDYQDGSLTFEMQGLYCRVQEEDGTWEIINRDDKVIFSGAEMIGDLPNVTCLGSAIVDGKAVLFELLPFEQNEEEIRIIANYESFVRISCVYNGQFAFVWTEDNLMGVVDYDGNVIVTPEYQKIEYAYRGGDYTMDELVFIAHGNNGIIQVINARNQEKIIES